MHWAERSRLGKRWHALIWREKLAGRISEATGRRRLTIERVSRGTLDADNLAGGAKTAIDAVKKLRLLIDDSPKHAELVFTQSKPKLGAEPHTIFTLEDLE